MAGDGINLGNLCVAENYIRSNYYSDTYSASFEINGVTKKWDIQHIQIPFSEQKRRAYIRRFGLPDDISLETVYRRLLIATKKHLIISQKLQETDNDRIKSSSVKIIYRKTSNRDKGGKDIYIVTEPMEPIIGSEIIDSKGTDLSSVMQIGIRLLQNAKNYNDAAYHCGTVDLDSVYVVKEQSRLTVKDGFFFYASSDDDENPAEYAPDAALFMDPEVYAGKKLPSFDSDIYAVCGLIWTLLSGNNHTVKPDFGTEPKYADAQITALLQKALTERSAAYKELAKGLRDKLNSINSGKEENTYITFSSIHRDKAPDFEAISQAPEASDPEEVEKKTGLFSRFRRQKADASEDEDDIDDDEEDDEEEDSGSFIKTLLKKVLALFIIALTIFVLIGIFMPRSSTPEPMPTETVAPTPSPTPTPTPTPTPKPTPTPTPRPTVKPDAPSIIFDSDWAWYKSDLSPSQIGTIEFVPFLEIHEGDCKILDSWVLDGGVTCYLLSNGEAEKLGFTPSSKTGSTVLIFAGNGADMIKTNFDQGQAIEYFQKKMNSVIVNGFGVTEVDQALAAAAATPSPSISPSPTPVKTQQVYQYNNSGSANNNGSGASTGVAAASPTESAHEPPKLDPFTVSPMSIELYVGGTYPVKMSYSSAVYYSITGVCEMTSGVNGEPVILGLAPGTCIVTFMCQDSTAGEYNGQTISITVTVLGDNSGSEFNTPGEENEPILPDIPSVDEDASILPEIPGLD